MRFLIIIPTIRQQRPGFTENIEAIRASFTLPTDLHVLDGKSGKAQTLNQSYHDLLLKSDAEIYVTMDDDYIPFQGWQDELSEAFSKLPDYGALAQYLGPQHEEYMHAQVLEAPRSEQGISIRDAIHINITGCMIAFRKQTAIDIGPIPEAKEKYQYWEDGWRCQRVRANGEKLAYIDGIVPEIREYVDSTDYLESKNRDIQSAKTRITKETKKATYLAKAREFRDRLVGRQR